MNNVGACGAGHQAARGRMGLFLAKAILDRTGACGELAAGAGVPFSFRLPPAPADG